MRKNCKVLDIVPHTVVNAQCNFTMISLLMIALKTKAQNKTHMKFTVPLY